MGVIGLIISFISAIFLAIGLIPFLGWFNWFTTLPAAVTGAIISGVAASKSKSQVAIIGLIISLVVMVMALGRLAIGCGII
jgi:hypothetical protein